MFNKKKDKFGIQLEAIAENLSRASVEFGEMDFDSDFDLKAYSDKIKAYESNGDDLMHQMITDLNQTFITPIEREDILELCDALDDVLDEMEETSAMFEMYSISYSDEYMAEFVKNIQAAIKEIAGIVSSIQAETQDVRQAMESGTSQVLNTTRLVENTKQNLAEVLEKSQTINQLMESISESTESQANTSQNVTSLMQKIAQLSAITSQSSTEVARSIGETARVAQKLESTVSQFKVADS